MKKQYKHVVGAVALWVMVAASSGAAAEPAVADDARPAVLKALDGNWTMSGDVMGKPVTYRLVAAPALQGKFTEMHMKDVQVPAKYEATVFLGVDPATGSVIVHWMDVFGAQGSIPHATGRIDGNTVQFIFPYKSGQFRDTFIYDPNTSSWAFTLEAAAPDGAWKHFARYDVRRAP